MSLRADSDLMDAIGHAFDRPDLLEKALCHSSYVNEDTEVSESNERMEFLGDAVLNLTISHLLMSGHPEMQEGQLSRMRAGLVNEQRLSEIANTVRLGEFLRLGRGERRSEGHRKASILADALEAVIAAVYLDGGYGTAFDVIKRLFTPYLDADNRAGQSDDHKTRLQEIVQRNGGPPPVYRLLEAVGPDHEKTFRVQVEAHGRNATGVGKTKKAAEQEAAHAALEIIATPS